MNINANELLVLKKIKFAGDAVNTDKTNEAVTTALSDEPEQAQAAMNKLMFQGLKNVVSDPQLAQETGALNNIETQPKEEETEKKEYVAPYKSNLAFQGKAGKVKTYLAAAMMGLAALGSMTTLQSCEDVEQYQSVTVDMDAIMAMVTELTAILKDMKEQNAITNQQMQQMNAYMLELIQEVKNGNIKADEFYTKMFNYMVVNNANQEIIIEQLVENGMKQDEANKLIKDLISEVQAGKISAEEAWNKIQNLLGDIKGLLTQVLADLKKYADRASEERQNLIDTNKRGFEELIKRGDITNETLKDLKAGQDSTIILSNKQIEAQEQIKEQIIKSNIDNNANFETVIKTLNVNKNEMISALMRLGFTQAQILKMTAGEIIKAIDKNTEITKQGNALLGRITKQLMILPELYKNGKITNAKLQEFYNLYQQAIAAGGEFTQEMLDKLDKLATELESIEGILKDMNETLKGMSENFNKFYQDYSDNKRTEFKMFGELIRENRFQSYVLVNMAKTQKDMAENLDGIKANTDTLLAIAKDDTRFNELINTIKDSQNGGNTQIDYNKLEQMFKLLNMNLTDVIKMSSSQLQQAIKDFQNTYVKTEQTQTDELKNINNKLGDLQIFLENNNKQDNKAVIDAINNLTKAVNDGKEDVTDELKAIEAKLDALQATVDALLNAVGEQAGKVDALFTQWGSKFDNILNSLENIDSKLATIIANQKIASRYLANIETEVKSLKAEIQKLQNQAGGNIDYDKLEEMWQKHDAENYEKYSKLIKDLGINPADLKTVEDLLKSIDGKMDNIKDNSDILTQILNKLNGIDWSSPDYSGKLDRVIELLENFKCNCNCGGSNEGILGDLDKILGE